MLKKYIFSLKITPQYEALASPDGYTGDCFAANCHLNASEILWPDGYPLLMTDSRLSESYHIQWVRESTPTLSKSCQKGTNYAPKRGIILSLEDFILILQHVCGF